ncbi:hypothetical protein ACPV4B_19125 [Vibrio parahaemolyticus]|uniref:hypothetical protein n=1 Tax=Vibrio mediterranei TaxID=689 RepID=UPI0040699054
MSTTPFINDTPPQNKVLKSGFGYKSYSRLLLTIVILLLCAIGGSKQFDKHSHTMVNESLIDAGVAFASVKSVSMAISAVKGIEGSVGLVTIRLGEILEPVNETLVYTSHVLMMAMASLGIQKVLLGIAGSNLGNILFFAAAGIAVASIWIPMFKRYQLLAKKVFFLTAFLRFSLAIVLAANALVDHVFLKEQIDSNLHTIHTFEAQLDQLPLDIEQTKPLTESEDKGLWERTKEKFGDVSSSFSSAKQQLTDLPDKFDDFVINFMNLIALFILKTIAIPIGFFFALKNILKSLFDYDMLKEN